LRTPPGRATYVTTSVIMTTTAPVPLLLTPPTCYETPAGSVWCFGQVQNVLPFPVDQITIGVTLLDAQGVALAQGIALCARTWLMSGEQAPYGLLIAQSPASWVGAIATLVGATQAADPHLTSVRVDEVRYAPRTAQAANSPWQVAGRLTNIATAPIREVLLVTTFLDPDGQVTGFRQFRLPQVRQMQAGESLAFEVLVIPQVARVARVTITAEARLK
jgi:hypothetical protein